MSHPTPAAATQFLFPDGRWVGVDKPTFVSLSDHFVVLSDLSDAFNGVVPVVDLRRCDQCAIRAEDIEFALDMIDAVFRPSAHSPLAVARHVRRLRVLLPTMAFATATVAYLLNTAPVLQWTGGTARLCDHVWFTHRPHRGQCMSVLHLGGTLADEWVIDPTIAPGDVVQGLRRQIARAMHAVHEVEQVSGVGAGVFVAIVRASVERFAATACCPDLTIPRHLRPALAALLPSVNAQGGALACVTGAVPPNWAGYARNISTGDSCTA